MFDDLIREMKRLGRERTTVSVSLPADGEGYTDRECPSPECLAFFKIHEEDSTNLVRDEVAYCPICRFDADAQSWFTRAQIEYAKSVAFAGFQERFDQALSRGVCRANTRSPRGGMISLSFSYQPGPRPFVMPISVGAVLEQRSTCEACGCRYASTGAAFFCPACGHNSAISTFGTTLETVRRSLDLMPNLPELVGKDAAADLGRQIVENGLVKLVTAFERFAEATYETLPDPKEAPTRNAFQRLDEGSRLWRSVADHGYEDLLPADELAGLSRFFQQRHLLAHEDGIVDHLYLDRSGDRTYKLGQRLVIRPAAVRRAAELIEKLARALRSTVPAG